MMRAAGAKFPVVLLCALIVFHLPNFVSSKAPGAAAAIPDINDFSGSSNLSFLTYLGGSGSDGVASIATDSVGNLYLAGTTSSASLPVSPDAFQPSNQGGESDIFVMKLRSSGSIVYATFLGGKGRDVAYGVTVDRLGNAYVTGFTDSKNFPTTEGALEGKGSYFTAKLNATGAGLEYSTRGVGGATIAVDASGNAFVAGSTLERDFPTTAGAFQRNFGGGQADAFVAKLNAEGDALIYATYLGGGRDEYISALALDRDGNAYVAGNFAYSPYGEQIPFPTTPGAYLDSFPRRPAAFVTKLNPTGSALVYSTYIEASTVSGIAVDDQGNAYVTGDATFVAATANAVQHSSSGVCCYTFGQFYHGGGDAFVLKLNRAGTALVYATYLGGSNYDAGRSISVDSEGNAYVVGFTDSTDFELAYPFQIANRGLIRSQDGGNEWSPASRGLKVGDVKVLVCDPKDPSILYAGSQIGLFKSTDSGSGWNAINNGLAKTTPDAPYPAYGVRALVIDPMNSSVLYSVLDSGLFKSIDAGNDWTLMRSGVNGIAFDPNNKSTIYAAAQTINRSTDGGVTWTDLNLGLGENINWVNKVVIAPTSPSTIFADLFLQTSTADSVGVIKSTDGGMTWQKVGPGPSGRGPFGSVPWSNVPLVVDSRTPTTVYSGSLKSTDSGETWNVLNFADRFLNALAIDPVISSTLYASAGQYTDAGLYKSTDGGRSWNLTALTGVSVYSILVDPKKPSIVYAGTGIVSDAFLTKLDPSGSAILFSTMLGGFGTDIANSTGVDSFGNVYIAGVTTSPGLPTSNALQSQYGGSGDAFLAMFGSPHLLNPKITGASIERKTLLVFGEDFDFGATLLIDGLAQGKTENDRSNPTTTLIASKSARKISAGHVVKLRIRNPEGTLSPEFFFTRP